MSEPKDFVAVLDSDARRTPRRIAFITKRTSPQVHVKDEDRVMTYPEVFFRAAVAIEVLAIALVVTSLLWDAPLEGLADPMHTPNPAKAPWYFLGLQELLHYFPPVVAGVLIPGLVVMALIVIPYFNINVEAEGLWLRDKARAPADLRNRRRGLLHFPGGLRCLGRSGSDAHRRGIHVAGSANRSADSPGLPAMAGAKAALLLDHDVVSG